MFVVLGAFFLGAEVQGVVRDVEALASIGNVRLRRRERFVLGSVVFLGDSLQVLLVSAGRVALLRPPGVAARIPRSSPLWLGEPGRTLVEFAVLDERIQVTYELLRVANGVAAFAGLYYAVTLVRDSEYREKTVGALTDRFHEMIARGSEHDEPARGHERPTPPGPS
jgi:hypothetical protein